MTYSPVFPRIKKLGTLDDENLRQIDEILPVKDWELLLTPDGEQGLFIHPHSGKPLFLEWDTESIVRMARTVLRHFDPTTEEQILETLQRIEWVLDKEEED